MFIMSRDGESLMEYLKWSSVFEHLVGKPVLGVDGGHVGSVIFPHMEDLMKSGELRKKEGGSLLLLRIPVL